MSATISKPKRKLAHRILIFLTVMAVGAPTLVGVSFFLMTRAQINRAIIDLSEQTSIALEKEIFEKSQELASKISVLLDERVKRLHSLLTATSINPSIVHLESAYGESLLKRLVYQNPSFLEISLTNPSGREIVKVSRDKIVLPNDLQLISSLKQFKEGEEARTYKTEVSISEETGLPYIVIYQPIERYRGSLTGWLVASIDLTYLWDLIAVTTVGKSGYAYVVSAKGQLISHPNKKLIYEGVDPFQDVFAHVSYYGKGTEKTEDYLFSYVHTTYLNWRIVTVLPLAEALEPVLKAEQLLEDYLEGLLNKMGQFLLLISPIFFIVGIILAVFLTKGITRPIVQLVDGTQAIRRGDLAARVNVKSDDEIGRLAESFNKMAEEMQRLVKKERELAAAAAAAQIERKRAHQLAEAYQKVEEAYEKLKSTQSMLLQAEKLSAVGQLASGVAHEVKNPLGIISQGLSYLEIRMNIKDPELLEDIGRIRQAIKRADTIIKGLLNLSRPAKLELIPMSFEEVIDSAIGLVEKELSLAGIAMKKDIASNLPHVKIDKNQMEQVFINLFLNAFHAMPQGGQITIKVYTKTIDEYSHGFGRRATDFFTLGEKAIVCEVQDTGTGIPKDKLKKVFEPFFTTKAPGKGTGLGMAVTRSIIDNHHGLIDLASEEGKGTTIIITLPVSAKKSPKGETV